MKVETKNGPLAIWFRYGFEDHESMGSRHITLEAKTTTCHIRPFVPEKTPEEIQKIPDIATGKAWHNPQDRYEKPVGRKIALSRALENAGFDRDIRKEIWESYWRRHRKP